MGEPMEAPPAATPTQGPIVPVLHVKEGELVARNPRGWASIDLERLRLPGLDFEGTGRRGLVALAAALGKAYGEVCVVDIDGLENDDPHYDLAAELDTRRVEAWWDTGPRDLDDAMDLLVSGAAKVTLRWGRMTGDDIEEATSMAETPLYVGLEAQDGRFLAPPRETPESLLGHAIHASGVVVIDLDRAGSAGGFHVPLLDAAKALRLPVYVAGGVASKAEAEALVARGAAGALVGTALLAGGIA